jgi:NAD(P)-dependent dehydrogenase (short-subunit alcohol dehydrogenase family)
LAIVVVTGSNSGFGAAGVHAFARNGDTVVATMRDPDRGRAMQRDLSEQGYDVHIMALDVTRTESFAGVFDDIRERFGRIDVLVNNAGILRPGSLEDISESDLRLVIETNAIAPILLSRAVLPHMRSQESGLIIMVSSLSGLAGLPGDVAYTASKFALEGASEALRHEVDRWNIRVALIEAGMYRTSIFPERDDDVLPDNYPLDSPYRPLVEAKLEGIYSRLPNALNPGNVGALMVEIAKSDSGRFRWAADDVARKVLATMLAQDDATRDAFLREVSGTDWWSAGLPKPPEKGVE